MAPAEEDEAPAILAVEETTPEEASPVAVAVAVFEETEQLHGAYIQGDTGPEILLYPLVLIGANGLIALRRRLRKNK